MTFDSLNDMKKTWAFFPFLIFFTLFNPAIGATGKDIPTEKIELKGGIIDKNTTLGGSIVVKDDIYVPPGVTLTFSKGTTVIFRKSKSSRVEPENFLKGTEITVRGNLVAKDTTFTFHDEGGFVVDRGRLSLSKSRIRRARFGILLLSGILVSDQSSVERSETGIMVGVGRDKDISIGGSGLVIEGCEIGAIVPAGFNDGKFVYSPINQVKQNTLRYEASFDEQEGYQPDALDDLKKGFSPLKTYSDLFLDRDEEWKGDVLVKGVVRVAPGARLTIREGSRIFFDFRDTNGDGIGESGIFLQGTLNVLGTENRPVIFASASGSGKGKWDSINFMASDQDLNSVEHAVVADSYRGLHSHFSRVSFKDVRIYRSFRGIQFQESDVRIENVGVFDSISVMRCRDSDLIVDGLYGQGNSTGINMFRIKGRVEKVFLTDELLYGIRSRESELSLKRVNVTGGIYSISLQEGGLSLEKISQSGALLAGLQAQASSLVLKSASFRDNGMYGLSFKRGKYRLQDVKIRGSGLKDMNLEGEPEVIIVR